MSGDIFAIGGHEDKTGDQDVLKEVVASMPRSKLVVVTSATRQPAESFRRYREVFGGLGVESVVQLDVHTKDQGDDPETRAIIDGAGGFFFTGGDQTRILEAFDGTTLLRMMRLLWNGGAMVGGTSAGASAMSETMLVRGSSGESADTDEVTLARGLGFLDRVIIDQHFAERGRVGRLLAAVALKPELLGLGVDENSAVCVRGDRLIALGEGAVTVLDASESECNSEHPGGADPLSLFSVTLHQLAPGDYLDLSSREPSCGEPR